ncbi:hypothetical protein DZF91_02915, partial [Actinomadura logoneensis]
GGAPGARPGARPGTGQGPAGSANGPVTPAIGASARLLSGAAGVRTGQVYPANGHAGVSAPELLFGLDRATVPATTPTTSATPASTPGTVPGAASAPTVPVRLDWRDACGALHHGEVRLAPGWHTVLLTSDGSIRARAGLAHRTADL